MSARQLQERVFLMLYAYAICQLMGIAIPANCLEGID